MVTRTWMKVAGASPVMLGLILACGGQQVTTRTVDDEAGEAIEYGAPEETTYEVQLDAGREYGTLVVYQRSTCDVIPVTVMQRYKETLRGDEVIERSPMNKRQVAGMPQGSIACDQTYARNVEVLLEADGGRFSLGQTDETGRVNANLAQVFKVASFDAVPADARIMLRTKKAQPLVDGGQISLTQLKKYDERVKELIVKLQVILEKAPADVTPDDITRSYELYNQMVEVAPHDPRVKAMAARFWELFYGRRAVQAREAMGKNLQALSEAQSTLKAMGDAALPIYVQAAVSSGTLDRQALEWSSLRLIRALRGAPAVCSGGFSWVGVPSYGWSKDAQLAAQYVHFAYGASHADDLRHACSRF